MKLQRTASTWKYDAVWIIIQVLFRVRQETKRAGAMMVALMVTCLPFATANAGTLEFSGYTWTVRDNQYGGPGPNSWDKDNVWVDEHGHLHLKISYRNGHWSCAEVYLEQRLGFGTYQFKIIGRPDQFDEQVVLGLFNYTRPDVGLNGTNEIDIEFAKWGHPDLPVGNWTVYPSVDTGSYSTQAFSMQLNGSYTTHRFTWSSDQIYFQALHGHQDGDSSEMANWLYQPKDFHIKIPQVPLPVHINLWLLKGAPPRDGQEVEIVISEFKYTPLF